MCFTLHHASIFSKSRSEGINDERNTTASAVRTSIPTIVNNQITYLNFEITTVTDDLYRKYITTFQDNNLVFENKYQYASGNSTYSSNLVSKEQFIIGTNIGNEEPLLTKDIEYTYDNQGRVIQIVKNNFLTTYTYDKYNRLVREDKEFFDRTYVMEYDKYGNIINKKVYEYNNLDNLLLEYRYNYDQENKMKLVSVTEIYNGDEYPKYEFEYNDKLQPTKYKDKELGWKNGRLNNYDNIYFNYLADGTRTQKGVFSEEYNNNGEMLFEKVTSYDSDNGNIYKENNGHTGKDLVFIEGTEGKAGFYYEEEAYFYRKNIFGDVIEIYKDGESIARYEYDAWGNHKVLNPDGSENKSSTFIGNINPIRYRGYYYDRETKLYYCNSRYYDPETGRWISMDSIEYLDPYTLNGVNLYVYCNNNPIMYADPSGRFAISVGLLIAGFVVGTFVGTASSIVTQGLTEGWDNINLWQVLLDGTIGGISGLLAFSGIGAFGSALISGGLGFVGSVGGDLIRNNGDWSQVNWGKAAVMTGMNFLLGWGPGVQNSQAIGKSLSSALSNNTGFKAVSKVLSNPKASARGIQGVFNRYGKTLAQGISSALPDIMISRMDSAFAVMLSTAVSTTLFSWGTDYFDLL